MTLPALYVLASDYTEAAQKLTDLDMPDEVIADTLESMKGDVEVKAANVAFVIRNLDSFADQIKEAESEMSKRRKAIEARADRMRQYLKDNMIRCGITKIESPYFKLSIRDNPPAVSIDDGSQIPSDYWREIPASMEIDKKLILQAIEDGFDVPGAHISRGQRLEIR